VEAVTIRYAPTTIRIPRAEITRVYVLEHPTQGRRLMGTAMPGLYEGRWSFAETGRITLYCTVQSRVVLIETVGGKWGITPDDPERFVQAFNKGEFGQWAPAAAGSFPWIILLPLIELPLFALVFWAVRTFMPDPRTIRYTLEQDSLLISGGVTRVRVPYSAISEVKIAAPPGTPFRSWGAGLPGLYWGSFAWKAAGPGLKLYATQVKPLVLISAGRSTYGVTPGEPEQFVAELARRTQR
jgi:hypothetical protein